jgi:hypothetical protein
VRTKRDATTQYKTKTRKAKKKKRIGITIAFFNSDENEHTVAAEVGEEFENVDLDLLVVRMVFNEVGNDWTHVRGNQIVLEPLYALSTMGRLTDARHIPTKDSILR